MRISIFTLLFGIICLLALNTTPLHANKEAEALLQWKINGLSSSTSLLDSSWSVNNLTNVCSWEGIICNSASSVSELNLPNGNIRGTLEPLAFSSLPNLTRINLNNNSFSGVIPYAISSLLKLTFLDLSNNNFKGAIPVKVGQLTQLRYFSCFRNFLNDVIPFEISNLQNLRYLDLGVNNLETPQWSKFHAMPLLSHLNLRANDFTLDFPEDLITSCPNLSYLDLSKNHFTGQIPESVFSKLQNLERLDLGNNFFQGPFPISLINLSNLKSLRLSYNNLSGTIPHEIGSITSLQALKLTNNSFLGNIPPSIGNLKHLQYLTLGFNLLNSTIPVKLGLCTNLEILYLYNNFLTGELPSSMSNLSKLVELDLSSNMLSGISPWNMLLDNPFTTSIAELSSSKENWPILYVTKGMIPVRLFLCINKEVNCVQLAMRCAANSPESLLEDKCNSTSCERLDILGGISPVRKLWLSFKYSRFVHSPSSKGIIEFS
nr:probable LRR receptor-like serine/threonine-protein kinase At4g08850 [Ipomoea batatas]